MNNGGYCRSCRGCNISRNDKCCLLEHVYLVKNVTEECPCLTCLVKVNCSKKCEDRSRYFRDVLQFSKQMRRRYG